MSSRLLRLRLSSLPTVLLCLALAAAACSGADSGTDGAASGSSPDESADDHDDHGDANDHGGDHDDAHDDADDHGGDHDDHGDAHDHAHGAVEIDPADAPSVEVVVAADPAGGVNVFVTTTDFAVAPASASTEHVDGEGHFHLFVDGEKVLRFYNHAIHFAGVTEGEVEMMVELSANDHSTYTVDGEPITATTVFDVPAHDHAGHHHGEPEPIEFAGAAPEIGLRVEADPKSGYNVFVTLDGMELSAENASGDHVDGQGHLHLYANGQKVGRLYGSATHLPVLPAGDVELRVAAYSNDHRPYVVDGVAVAASTMVTVAG